MAKAPYVVIRVKPDNSIQVEEHDGKPGLDFLQEAVKGGCPYGLIAPVDRFLPPGVTAYVHDEGICWNEPVNLRAQLLTRWPSVLFGDCVISFKKSNKLACAMFDSVVGTG